MRELHTPSQAASWLRGRVTGTLRTDSRTLAAGDGFLAWPGASADARAHVPAALERGAAACLVEHAGVSAYRFADERVASCSGLKLASGPIAAEFFEWPSRHVDVLAVTGTNGKTSTVWWLAQALSCSQLHPARPCAMVGTLGVGRPPSGTAGCDDASALASLLSTGLTTPDAVLLQASLRRFADSGVRACAIEASSIGLEQQRLAGTRIQSAIFTNFTQDHLDYHGDMQSYWNAKARLFDRPELRSASVNVDDAKGAQLADTLRRRALDLWTVSCQPGARLHADAITHGGTGVSFDVVEGRHRHRLDTTLVGQYNVSNLLGVLATMRALGVPLSDAVAACRTLAPVPGRMQRLGQPGTPLVAVDYAHTPDALEKALDALRPLTRQRGGSLWCVFGCGGDRDPAKRELMGAVAAKAADHVVVTSDNPRGEDPQDIMRQILPGLAGHPSVSQQADRALAIAQTLEHAGACDVVLVAGKGHEAYQEVAGVRRPFSDVAQVRQALQRWHAPGRPQASSRAAVRSTKVRQ